MTKAVSPSCSNWRGIRCASRKRRPPRVCRHRAIRAGPGGPCERPDGGETHLARFHLRLALVSCPVALYNARHEDEDFDGVKVESSSVMVIEKFVDTASNRPGLLRRRLFPGPRR
jgi:hypothetical protein